MKNMAMKCLSTVDAVNWGDIDIDLLLGKDLAEGDKQSSQKNRC